MVVVEVDEEEEEEGGWEMRDGTAIVYIRWEPICDQQRGWDLAA